MVESTNEPTETGECQAVITCPHCKHKFSFYKRMKRRNSRKIFVKDGHTHEYIRGVLAHTERRLEIYRNAGGEASWFDHSDPESVEDVKPAMCQGCAEPHPISWAGFGCEKGEWHHNCPLRKKCDSAKCALYVCATVHRLSKAGIHRRVLA